MSRRGFGERSQIMKRPMLMDIDSCYDGLYRKRMAPMPRRGGGPVEDSYRSGEERPPYRPDEGFDGWPAEPPVRRLTQSQPSVSDRPSFVLLITIHNPKYPINVDVLNTICAADRRVVNRIMIFRKKGVQALVEFDSVDMAIGAMETLDGADIYSNCCTLRIEFAKPLELAVVRNDSDSWDYTDPRRDRDGSPRRVPALLPEPKFNCPQPREARVLHYGERDIERDDYEERRMSASRPGGPRGRGVRPLGMEPRRGPAHGYDDGYDDDFDDGFVRRERERYPPIDLQEQYNDRYGPPSYSEDFGRREPLMRGEFRGSRGGLGDEPMGLRRMDREEGKGETEGCVLMVYGCSESKMNCQRLFNLLCVYGNVVKIKFLKTKENSAMVQMGDLDSCERVIENLNNCQLFGQKLCVSFSKQPFVNYVGKPLPLSDGTPNFADFSDSRHNRYTTPEAVARNKLFPPSNALFFFNLPPGTKEGELKGLLAEAEVKSPSRIKVFEANSEKTRTVTGVVEWENKADCMEALIAANHITISNPASKHPFVLKFAFTNPGRN